MGDCLEDYKKGLKWDDVIFSMFDLTLSDLYTCCVLQEVRIPNFTNVAQKQPEIITELV